MDTAPFVDLLQPYYQAAAAKVIKDATVLLSVSVVPAVAALGILIARRRSGTRGVSAWQWGCFGLTTLALIPSALLMFTGMKQEKSVASQTRGTVAFIEKYMESAVFTRQIHVAELSTLDRYLHGDQYLVSYSEAVNSYSGDPVPRIGANVPKAAFPELSALLKEHHVDLQAP